MYYDQVFGHQHLISHLQKTVVEERIAHAQLFNGPEGSGTLALAIGYAKNIIAHRAENKELSLRKLEAYAHPDLLFSFPTANLAKPNLKALSENFINEWISFLRSDLYGGIYDWYQHLGIENKQGIISVEEANNLSHKLSLTSYEGGYKVLIIWQAEALRTDASNKLLKLIEEPPKDTIILLVTEHKEQMLNTILSRCQLIEVPPLPEQEIIKALISRGIEEQNARTYAQSSNGNLNYAFQLSTNSRNDAQFEEWFIHWVRIAFKARGSKQSILPLLDWSEALGQETREVQKQFILFCINFFRQALMLNYGIHSLVHYSPDSANFKLENFAKFVHQNNIQNIYNALEKALDDIVRNGNSKLIFSDLSIKLTRFLHIKE